MPNESFITTPGITKKEREEVSVDGEKFYTNEKLRNFVIEVAEKKLPKTQAAKIKKLVNEKKVVPLFMTKNLWDYFRNRYKHTNYRRNIRGFLHNRTKIIYIIMDNMLLKGILVTNKLLIEVIVHELVHLAFDTDPKRYLQINLPILTNYYYHVFSMLFNIPKNRNIKNIVQRFVILYVKDEKNNSTEFNDHYKLFDELYKFTDLTKKEFENIVDRYLDFIYYEIKDNDFEIRKNYQDIRKLLTQAFVKAFNVPDHDSTPNQRAYITSEVIATLAMVKPKSKFVTQTINIIK